jgi:predicted small integral membrane protein
MFEWMAWTLPVAVFFTCIVLMLAGMTVWELRSPTVLRKGFLPMATTRGDRLFIGLLAAAWLNLAFVGLSERMVAWFGSRGAVGLDRLRRLDARARADPEKGLTKGFQKAPANLPSRRFI